MIQKAARLSRRSVVGAVAVGTVAGCSGGGGGDGSGAGAVPRPGAAEQARAVRDSVALLRAYDAALAAHPALAGRLAPLRAEVARHIQAFGGQAPQPPSPATTAQPVPSRPAAALTALAAMERTLADRRAAALLTVPGESARLMASVAAAGAGHVLLLTAGAKKI